ncbi:hypothetical protein [Streptomyces caniscabiei]|nr:hypothetical protein [Streptomyces caniscabiei]
MGHATDPQQPTHHPRATEPLPPAGQAALARLDRALAPALPRPEAPQ